MAQLGYHASHEQFNPRYLLEMVKLAEKAGFGSVLSSDHFHPWSERQGESGFAWSWLGAAMEASKLDFGIVNAPGQRYHPALIAQASATLDNMFPGRFWLAQGSGQFLNEHITGEKWPDKKERNKRLKECVNIIRSLWRGDTVTQSETVKIEEAKLYTKPLNPPLIIGAALTPETAKWIGSWADGMITISQPGDKTKKVVDAFREGGGEAKPMYIKVQLSYSDTFEKALEGAHEEWRNNVFESKLLSDIKNVEQFDAAGEFISRDQVKNALRISADPSEHLNWIKEDIKMGFEKIFLHNVNREQEKFIKDFGEYVLPHIN